MAYQNSYTGMLKKGLVQLMRERIYGGRKIFRSCDHKKISQDRMHM